MGSSPLARGLLPFSQANQYNYRIIPARAGSTYLPEEVTKFLEDHPRSRGVYLMISAFWLPRNGSSPLARGLLRRRRLILGGARIIPARAGSTLRLPRTSALQWDHPRSRGVYSTPRKEKPCWLGSSPLARGLPASLRELVERRGIIPARAGSTRLGTTT